MGECDRGRELPTHDRSRRRRSKSRRRGRRHSRHRHSGRKRHRSPSRSTSSSRSPSRSSSSSRGSSRSYGRRWHNNSSGSTRGTADTTMERPVSDWVCGVCSNPNSAKRVECFRCGTPFAVAISTTRCEELRITGIPSNIAFEDIRHALEAHFTAHGDTCNIIAYHVDNNDNTDITPRDAHVQFDTVAEATRAVTYARSTLWLGDSACSMTFAQRRRANRKPPTATITITTKDPQGSGVSPVLVDGLPSHLQPVVWQPVDQFPSEEAEKAYLDLLSKHWDKISRQQKDYYDERVRRALAAQRRKQQQQQHARNVTTSTGTTVVGPMSTTATMTATTTTGTTITATSSTVNTTDNSNIHASALMSDSSASANSGCTGTDVTTTTAINSSTLASASTTSGGGYSVESINRRLMEKKQAVQNASSATEHTTSAASLKERLALKRAQLSSAAAKTQSTPEAENAANVGISSASAPTTLKDTPPAALHLFCGFPIPSRFPTKTDYLTNSKSPSSRAGVTFRYVPPAVAERIVPPSARPPAV